MPSVGNTLSFSLSLLASARVLMAAQVNALLDAGHAELGAGLGDRVAGLRPGVGAGKFHRIRLGHCERSGPNAPALHEGFHGRIQRGVVPCRGAGDGPVAGRRVDLFGEDRGVPCAGPAAAAVHVEREFALRGELIERVLVIGAGDSVARIPVADGIIAEDGEIRVVLAGDHKIRAHRDLNRAVEPGLMVGAIGREVNQPLHVARVRHPDARVQAVRRCTVDGGGDQNLPVGVSVFVGLVERGLVDAVAREPAGDGHFLEHRGEDRGGSGAGGGDDAGHVALAGPFVEERLIPVGIAAMARLPCRSGTLAPDYGVTRIGSAIYAQ